MILNSTVKLRLGQSYSVAESKTAVLVNCRPKLKDWIILGPFFLISYNS